MACRVSCRVGQWQCCEHDRGFVGVFDRVEGLCITLRVSIHVYAHFDNMNFIYKVSNRSLKLFCDTFITSGMFVKVRICSGL